MFKRKKKASKTENEEYESNLEEDSFLNDEYSDDERF